MCLLHGITPIKLDGDGMIQFHSNTTLQKVAALSKINTTGFTIVWKNKEMDGKSNPP
jgi:hypothetical protein